MREPDRVMKCVSNGALRSGVERAERAEKMKRRMIVNWLTISDLLNWK
jgi:hypothetical protein